MAKKTKRTEILYAHIQRENQQWIKAQIRELGFSTKRGKSKFIDALFTTLRAHGKLSKTTLRKAA